MNLKQIAAHGSAMIASRMCYILEGPPGVGKSAIVEQIAAAQGEGFGYAVIMGPALSPVDVNGFMIPTRDPGGQPIATFTRPVWMQTRDRRTVTDFPKGGILLIDEFGQTDPDTKRALADLLLNRRIGQHVMPENWVVWGATNRVTDRSGVTRNFDFLINRVVSVRVDPDLEALLDFQTLTGVHPTVIAFTKQHPNLIFADKVPEVQGPWPTPRSVCAASRILAALSPDGGATLPSTPEAIELVSGTVGQGAAAQLMAFVRMATELPTFEEVIKSPSQAKLPKKADATVLVAYALAARATQQNIGDLLDYIQRIDLAEYQLLFVRASLHRNSAVMAHPKMAQWFAKNANLAGLLDPTRPR